MTLGAATLVAGDTGWRINRQPGPDLAAQLVGRKVEEVAELLPRLFNLCRMAQATAARLALGLPVGEADAVPEVIRDHQARLCVTLRRAFGLSPLRPGDVPPVPPAPLDLPGLDRWLKLDHPAAELGRAVREAPACAGAGGTENSPAARQADHPLLQTLARQGHGALWRYMGMLVDLQAAEGGALPPPRLMPDGTAVVQAARGAYRLRITQSGGRVTGLWRRTPTDDQLAPGGPMDRALRHLPPDRPDLAARLVALFDPCIPVTVPEAHHA